MPNIKLTWKILPKQRNVVKYGHTDIGVVVAQLAKRLLLMPEVRSSNSHHRQFFIMDIFTGFCWRDRNKDKEAGNGTFLKYKIVDLHTTRI